MLIVLAVILFVFSAMSGSFTRTTVNPSLFDHLVNGMCGVLSVVTGLFFCVLVRFLWSDGPFELHGYPEHAALMLGGLAPGLLGFAASVCVKKITAHLNAESAAEEA